MTQRCVSITTFRKKPQDKAVNQPLLKSYQDHRAEKLSLPLSTHTYKDTPQKVWD